MQPDEIAEAVDIHRPLHACCGYAVRTGRTPGEDYFLPFFFAAFFAVFFFAAFLAT
jgi:hypothetical protein